MPASPWFSMEDLAEVMPDFPEAAGPSLITAREGDVWICGPVKIRTVGRAFGPDVARLVGDLLAGRQADLVAELAPAYVDGAVIRWQILTGLDATLEQDGRAFAAVQAERLAEAVSDDAAWA